MAVSHTIKRYIYKTHGVCPPEIYFHLEGKVLTDVRFAGGGCPGNAHLVSRLLKGRPIEEVLELVQGIECRNGTSCPDQLSLAIRAVVEGTQPPADSFVLAEDPVPMDRVGIIGALDGDPAVLNKIAAAISKAGIRNVICMGDLTGRSPQNAQVIKNIRTSKIQALQGRNEWDYARRAEGPQLPSMDQRARNWLGQLPQVLIFHIGAHKCMAFFGDYIQQLPGYSDYEPYALELNMVCGLADFMQDETVLPALEAMLPQFGTDAVLFSQTKTWGQWHLGGKTFISVGPAAGPFAPSWGLLEVVSEKLHFTRMTIKE